MKADIELLEATPVAFKFGSKEWAEAVFNDAPSRKVSGRSKGTHRVAAQLNGVTVDLEGHESCAAYILEYLQLAKVVQRWKAQPFAWRPVVGEGRKKPDFLVELSDGLLALLQVKAESRRTPKVDEVYAIEREIAESVGMAHVIWTSEHMLNRKAKTLYFRLRAARNTRYDQAEMDELLRFVHSRERTTILDIAQTGMEPALVAVAIRRGDLFVDMREEYDERTAVATNPIIDGRSYFLQSGFDAEAWWHGLSR